jgi:hypothetical protein
MNVAEVMYIDLPIWHNVLYACRFIT